MADQELPLTGRFSKTATARWPRGRRGGQRACTVDHADTDAACRALVKPGWGPPGWLQPTRPSEAGALDVRTLCLCRETLARHDGLADFAFAMQGLGTGAISLFGTRRRKRRSGCP
jgi:acyl-CoA dehydrogenase